jgi:hypothetical protein
MAGQFKFPGIVKGKGGKAMATHALAFLSENPGAYQENDVPRI